MKLVDTEGGFNYSNIKQAYVIHQFVAGLKEFKEDGNNSKYSTQTEHLNIPGLLVGP
jgi:hypothetical protein